jgi:hypothetical protein
MLPERAPDDDHAGRSCQSFAQGCIGCCVNMRWSDRRIQTWLARNTRTANRLLRRDARPSQRTLIRWHLTRGGLWDHLLMFWLVPFSFGLSAWIWNRYFASCCFAGFLETNPVRVGCLIHPKVRGEPDLRHFAFPMLPTAGCNRELLCPMLQQKSPALETSFPDVSRDGFESLRKKCGKNQKKTCLNPLI